jgi:thiamine transporter 2/3
MISIFSLHFVPFFFYVSFSSSYQVAKEIRPDSYGLIFGVNVFFALFFQTILTVVVVEPAGLGLPPRSQVNSRHLS